MRERTVDALGLLILGVTIALLLPFHLLQRWITARMCPQCRSRDTVFVGDWGPLEFWQCNSCDHEWEVDSRCRK